MITVLLLENNTIDTLNLENKEKLENALLEIKHLKAVIEGKDKLLEEKERLINVLMNK